MNHDGPRHRGACSIDERKQAKRRFFKPGLRVSAKVFYEGLKSALDAERLASEKATEESRILFMADCSDIRFLRLQHSKLFPRR